MTKQYLDKTGLTYFWGKLKNRFQDKLVSGTNIKTINNESLLGSGDISISGGSSEVTLIVETTNLFTLDSGIYKVDSANTNAELYIPITSSFVLADAIDEANQASANTYIRVFDEAFIVIDKVPTAGTKAWSSVTVIPSVDCAFQEKWNSTSQRKEYDSGHVYNNIFKVSNSTPNYKYYDIMEVYQTDVELNSALSNYLAKDNTTAFTPTGDYQPATKKYVDDNSGTTEVAIQITQPTGDETVWINPDELTEVPTVGLVLNERSTSTTDTYSSNYVNGLIKTSQTSSANATYSCDYSDSHYKPTVLYSGQSTTGVTLSDSINNYTFVEVIGIRGEGHQVSSKAAVYQNGTTRLCLVDCYYGYGTSMWVDQLGIAISGTTLSIDQYSSCYGSGNSLTVSHDQNIKIYRVLGYKY